MKAYAKALEYDSASLYCQYQYVVILLIYSLLSVVTVYSVQLMAWSSANVVGRINEVTLH